MKCPSDPFLELFVDNPDAALEEFPQFESHLECCKECQGKVERLGDTLNSGDPCDVVFGKHPDASQIPEIAGYRLLEQVGARSFGVVYRALHLESSRPVAVKIIRRLDPSHWKRIVLEREALVQCDHPNVITLLDCGQCSGGCYFVYRWMEQSLGQYIGKESVVDLHRATSWIIQIASAVEHIHGFGIVHRDLKPSNILLSKAGVPRIIDFGIAKNLTSSEASTIISHPVGTPGFMAPEQTGRIQQRVSFGTDVYGLGAVLYALITGRPPFIGGDPIQTLDQVVHSPPIAPRRLRWDIPRDLEVICLKCLEKNPSDRYASPSEMAEDLERFASGRAILARPVSTVARLWRWSVKQPLVTGLIVALILLSIGTATTLAYSRQAYQRQLAILATQSLLKSIASVSSDKLNELYAETSSIDPDLMSNSLPVAEADPLAKIRWMCIFPNEPIVAVIPDELVDGLCAASAEELPILVPRLSKCPMIATESYLRGMCEEVLETQSDATAIRVSSLLAEIDSQWDQWPRVVAKIARGLTQCPASESQNWSRSLRKISPVLLQEIFQQEKNASAFSDYAETNSDASDVKGSLGYLDSESMRAIVWQWVYESDEHILGFVECSPLAHLGIIASLNQDQELRGQVVARLHRRWRALADEMNLLRKPQTINDRLNGLFARDGGIVTNRRGFVLATPYEETSDLIEALAQNGLSLSSIQPYLAEEKMLFAAAFEKSDDVCEVDWSLALDGIESSMRDRRNRGFEAAAFWVHPKQSPDRIAVLWRKGGWKPSRFLHGATEVALALSGLSEGDADDIQSELRHQVISNGGERIEFGLVSMQPIAKRDEQKRRFASVSPRPFGETPVQSTARQVEFFIDGSSYLSQYSSSEISFAEQNRELISFGFEPLELCVDYATGQIVSLWFKPADREQSARNRIMASLAIASWILGEPDLVLESIDWSRDPSLRTVVVESLGRVDRDSQRFLIALDRQLTPSQFHGLLLALGNWHRSEFIRLEKQWHANLERLWMHPDSEVHFAADYLFRKTFPGDANKVVDDELSKKHNLQSLPYGRNWYYGPFGLPFVIFEPKAHQLVGTDERLPWVTQIDRRLTSLNRKIAVCAVETPEWLMRKNLEELGRIASDRMIFTTVC